MKILCPVDGSGPAERAVAQALRLLRGEPDAEILLVNIQGPQTYEVSDVSAVMTVDGDRAVAARQANEALRRPIQLCEDAGVRFATAVESGAVADTIARLAELRHVDQIVMGTRGLGALGRLLLGSVATRVAQLAVVPVTLVK